jgi:hypothetical protein
MKKNSKMIMTTCVVALLTMGFGSKFMSGGFGDSTGAPMKTVIVSQYKGCNSTGGHTGKPLNDFTVGFVDVVSDIPLTGWVPNATYNITVTAVSPNRFAYGFQFTAWGKTDSVTKGILLTPNTDVQIRKSLLRNAAGVKLDSNYYATHKTSSAAHGSGNSKWTFQWTSPSVKNQEIRFYLTAICANASGSSLGDYVYRINKNDDSSSLANPNVNAVGIKEFTAKENISVFPTVTTHNVTIAVNTTFELGTAYVLDMNGKIVLKTELSENSNSHILKLTELESGAYIIKIQSANYNFSKKIIKL